MQPPSSDHSLPSGYVPESVWQGVPPQSGASSHMTSPPARHAHTPQSVGQVSPAAYQLSPQAQPSGHSARVQSTEPSSLQEQSLQPSPAGKLSPAAYHSPPHTHPETQSSVVTQLISPSSVHAQVVQPSSGVHVEPNACWFPAASTQPGQAISVQKAWPSSPQVQVLQPSGASKVSPGS